jgi:hypothetical protein
MKPSRPALALLALAAMILPLTISGIGTVAKTPKPPKYKGAEAPAPSTLL